MPKVDFTRSGCAVAAIVMLAGVFLAAPSGRVQAAAKSDAAKPYALIIGTVYDPDNHPAYGVKIKIQNNQKKKFHWEAYSNHQGEFAVRVPAGAADYNVSAQPLGKSPAGTVEITVHIDNDERKDIGLHLTPAGRI